MSYPTIKKISLDIYNNLIVGFNAKQGDIGSRYVEITATENGKKIVLDAESVKVYIRYKKADGKVGLVNGTIQDDGTIIFEITQQMLAASGRCNFDVILADATGYINVDGKGRLVVTDTSVISTMPFYINVLASSFDDTMLKSSSEFAALSKAITENIALASAVKDAEQERQNTFESSMTDWDNQIETMVNDCNAAEQARQNLFESTMSDWDKQIDDSIQRNEDAETARANNFNNSMVDWNGQIEEVIKNCNDAETQRTNNFNSSMNDWNNQIESTIKTCNDAESLRVEAEELRVQEENNRSDNETKRVQAESDRASQFSTSMEQWNKDVNDAIKKCDDAEALRAEAEASRVNAEEQRSTDFTSSMIDWGNQVNDSIKKNENAEIERTNNFNESMIDWENQVNTAIEGYNEDVANKIAEWDQEVADAESAREDAFDSLKENWASEVDKVVKSANDAVTTVNATNETVSQNEEQRIANETSRQESETLRQTAETLRQENYDSLIGQIDTSVERINNAIGGIINDESVDIQTTYSSSKITTFDTKDNVVSFDSYDVEESTEWTDVDVLASEEKHSSIFSKISTMFKNIKYIWKMIGQTDISSIGDGTITGTINMLNDKASFFSNTYMKSKIYNGVYEIAIQTRYSDWVNGNANRQSIFIFGNDNNDMFFGTIQIYNSGTCSFTYKSKTDSVYTVEKSDNGQIILKLPVIIYDYVTAISASQFSLL